MFKNACLPTSAQPSRVTSRRQFLALAASTTVLAGCADTTADTAPVVGTPSARAAGQEAVHAATPSGSPHTSKPVPSPAAVHANELGMIPVLMHHRLVSGKAGTY